MKLLHVVPCYLPGTRYGGPIASVHGLSRALVGRGHEVTVFTTDRDGFAPLEPAPPRHAELDGVRVVYHPVGAGARFHRSPDLAHSLERVAEFDLVHVHGLYSWPTTAAARGAERAAVPLVAALFALVQVPCFGASTYAATADVARR